MRKQAQIQYTIRGIPREVDVSDLVGRWTHDPGSDEILAAQRRITTRGSSSN